MNLAHLHLVLNHFPIVGTVIGLGLFVVSCVGKNDDLKRASLLVLAAMALLALPTFFSGIGAQGAIRRDPAVSAVLIERHEGAAMLALFRRYQDFQGSRERLAARCKRAPKDFEAHRQMANFHMTAHEYPAAITYFSRCLELQPNNTQIRRNLIVAQGFMGQRENQKLQLDILAKQEIGDRGQGTGDSAQTGNREQKTGDRAAQSGR